MKKLTTIALGCLAFGLAGAAQAQTTTTTQQTMPNGNTRTTTHVDTPDGTAATRTIDRADGTRTVVRRQTDVNGNVRSVATIADRTWSVSAIRAGTMGSACAAATIARVVTDA